MKAFVVHQITEDLSGAAFADVEDLDPQPGGVVVGVTAAGVNFPDLLMCQGKYQFKPEPPFVPGLEATGVVEAVGADVDTDWIGRRVVVGARMGGFAQRLAAPLEAIRPIPEGMDDGAAAGYQAAYLTAYVALVRRARVQAGETVLVHGAAGGVGLACVDLALHLGATVIATASTPEKRAFLALYGAHHVLEPSGFRNEVKSLTQGRGADVIYDPVGGDVFDESVRCIAFDGRLLVIGFTSGRIPSLSANMAMIKGFSLMGVRAGEYGRQFPERGRENLEAIWRLASKRLTRPHVSARVPLAETKHALALLADRAVIGKVILVP